MCADFKNREQFTWRFFQFVNIVFPQADEIQTDWKPQFLSTEEFTHLMLEAVDGFIIVLGTDGHIMYTSESLASLLGYLPSSLHNTTLYEMVADTDKIPLYNTLNTSPALSTSEDHQVCRALQTLTVLICRFLCLDSITNPYQA